jgi:lysophospholipase L1-like esterase
MGSGIMSRILFYGDSIAREIGDAFAKTHLQMQCQNTAIGGATTLELLVNFKHSVVRMHPDLVFLSVGTAARIRGEPESIISKNTIEMLRLAYEAGIPIIPLGIPNVAGTKYDCGDRVHWTPEGYEFLARNLCRVASGIEVGR